MSAGLRRPGPLPHEGARGAAAADPWVDRPAGPPVLRNADVPWDGFDSEAYLRHNYGSLHDLDRAIIDRMAGFFGALMPVARRWHGIDVGTGSNLYPALAMLPLVETITLWERSRANVRWLEHSLRTFRPGWEPFWDALTAASPVYRQLSQPQALLPTRTKVERGSVFDLPEAGWDVGTMFFVAESITGDRAEFELAMDRFMGSLKPGAPFVAAFVRNSQGYPVGERRFPAVAITEDDVARLLRRTAADVEISRIGSAERFREGYDGMVLVTGVRAGTPQSQLAARRPSERY